VVSVSEPVSLAAYALAVEVDRRNGEVLGTCQPMSLTAFVADLREMAREVIPRDVVHSSPSQEPR
jgi:hypothetical protein